MKEFTYSEARQRLAELLDWARRDGAVRIRRRDGQIFIVHPAEPRGSPLDVGGEDLGLTSAEIVAMVHESRRPS